MKIARIVAPGLAAIAAAIAFPVAAQQITFMTGPQGGRGFRSAGR